jgi:transposase-like protein
MELENQTIRRPRRRFSVEEKARVVGLYKQSGLTRSEFCRREGVSLFNLRALAGKGGSEQSGALCGA